MEKAFDRIHWGYLLQVLDAFGLQGGIHDAIALYTHPSAHVFMEGVFSEKLMIAIGTRQGCPLLPLIFALLVEPLTEKLRSHTHLEGIKGTQNISCCNIICRQRDPLIQMYLFQKHMRY